MDLYIYDNYENSVVIEDYLHIIGNAFSRIGFDVHFIKEYRNLSRKALILFSAPISFITAYVRGYHNLCLWEQGIAAEESYIRNQSKLRYKVISLIDSFAIKKARFVFFVSDYMKVHYEKMIGSQLTDKSFVMPCFNEDKCFVDRKNYDALSFAYVGSLSKWQCFEKTIALYEKIERFFTETSLLVLTFEVEQAKKVVKEYNLKNVVVKSVSKDDVSKYLAGISYGFIIRDDIEINRVATPTKFSSYLSAGVIPIYSSCLRDYNEKVGIGFAYDENDEKLLEYLSKRKDCIDIVHKIQFAFTKYYNKNYYIQKLSKPLINTFNVTT